jgi:hypothetical protein
MSRPEHEAAACVLVHAAAFSQAGALEAFRVLDIRREKDVEGRPVLDLREEIPRRAKGQPDLPSGVLLELRRDCRERGLQIGRRGDRQALCRGDLAPQEERREGKDAATGSHQQQD